MNWYAFWVSVLWGLTYACTENTVKSLDTKTYLAISSLFSLVMFLSFGAWDGTLIKDVTSSKIPYFYIIIGCVSALVASYFSVVAVKTTNATNAAILEMSYPLFTIIFTYLLTRTSHLNISTLLGGILIGCGTLVVVLGKK